MEKKLLLLVPCTIFLFALNLPKNSFSQNIGIGTASPVFKLDVRSGSINTDSVYRIGGLTILSVKGTANTFTGVGAGLSITSGSLNTATGASALYFNTTGVGNTAIGESALYSNTTGVRNTANGIGALYSNTTGLDNTANGVHALLANTTGESNTAIGIFALGSNTTGNFNTAGGRSALTNNTTGSFNTTYGANALLSNTTGSNNTAIGTEALRKNTTGDFNTADGVVVLFNNTTGYRNTAHGAFALQSNTTGYENTAIGSNAGDSYSFGHQNVFVGAYADANVVSSSNVIAIGYSTIAPDANTARFGNAATTSYGGWAGWTNVSDGRFKKNIKENVPGIHFINKLRPVSYTLDATALDAFFHKNDKTRNTLNAEGNVIHKKALLEKDGITYTGFIAQEVEAAANELGFNFSGVDPARNENDTYGLRYAEFVVPLVKAMQELSKRNEDLERKNEELNKRIEKLESLLISKN